MPLSKSSYAKYKTWNEQFSDNKVILNTTDIHSSWKPAFESFSFDKINNTLSTCLEHSESLIMHPSPSLVFNAFRATSLNNLKVVIIGQDPYFNHEMFNGRAVSQAMGLSFSVPRNFAVPSSLVNIYSNLYKNKHILKIPQHGDLSMWAYQGCLLLNTALTVLDGPHNKECHLLLWKRYTDHIIKYISTNCDNIVFVIWGAKAYEKLNLVDLDKHKTVISSHPSGLSASSPMKNYPAFINCDTFGQINKYLIEWHKEPIIWDI